MNEAIRAIYERSSTRGYLPTPLTEEELKSLEDAALASPTARNMQSPIIVAVQDKDEIETLRKMNASIMGTPDSDPFYGAPTAVVVLADGEQANWLQDGSLVMGNLMLAAASLGVGSCWINRAKEYFDMPEGKELLKKWELPETLRGVGICILGYAEGEAPAPKPRKEGYIVRV